MQIVCAQYMVLRSRYDHMRERASAVPWDNLQHDDIDVYADNIFSVVENIARECVPNKNVRIKASEPPWITSSIKSLIRKRKRAYKKARKTDVVGHWQSFRGIRNKVISIIRQEQKTHFMIN